MTHSALNSAAAFQIFGPKQLIHSKISSVSCGYPMLVAFGLLSLLLIHGVKIARSVAQLPQVEYDTLQDLFIATNGDEWAWLDDPQAGIPWVFTATANPCFDRWQGLNCTVSATAPSTYHVSLIHLPSYNLVGQLPSSLGNLGQLLRLSLASNQLSGQIPSTVTSLVQLHTCDLSDNGLTGPLPTTIGSMTALYALDLRANALTGPIPVSIGDLPDLLILDLDSNQLTSSIPASIGQCSFLFILDLSYNELSHAIPTSISSLAYLRYLDVSNNDITGSIPDSIGDMLQLRYLHLFANQLRGAIPSSVGGLVQLIQLDLSVNALTGPVPTSISHLDQLTVLQLSNNQLAGGVSDVFAGLPALYFLALEFNRLTGSVASSIAALSQLQYLVLASNALNGTIPEFLGELPELLVLDLSNNTFTGGIPATLCNLTKLAELSLQLNRLTGTVPEWIGNQTALQLLYLFDNQLNGTVPSAVGQLTELLHIDFDDNVLTGPVPASINNLGALQVLSLANNQLTGPVPEFSTNLHRLQFLYLSSNALTSTVPASVGLLSALTVLDLRFNTLEGSIPTTICNLTQLKDMYLNTNGLTGPVPDCFDTMMHMQILYLFDNALTGAVPSSIGPLQELIFLKLSNNMLTGTMPALQAVPLLLVDISKNSLTGTVPASIQYLTSLVSLELHGNQLDGPIDHVFSAAQTALINVQLDNNQFTGELPSALFDLPSLVSLSIVGSCLHGSLPDNICNATQLEALILYGLTTGSSCRGTGLGALSQSRHAFAGAFPSCVLGLPHLVTLLLSSNGLTGSISSSVTPSPTLLQLDVSHNSLSGAIPSSVQNHTWSLLDLSHNRLDGVLQSSLLRPTNVTLFDAHIAQLLFDPSAVANQTTPSPTVSLSSNRLSGPVPRSLMPLHNNLSVLAGNLFECKYDKSDLPQHDSDLSNYVCASNDFNAAIYTWLGLCVCSVVLIVAVYSHQGTILPMLDAASNIRLPDDLSARLTHLHSLLEEYHVIHKTAWWCAAFCLVVLLPYYAIASQYAGTHTYTYAYVLSAIYTSGVVPFVFTFLLLAALLVINCYCCDLAGKLHLTAKAPMYENSSVDWLRGGVWCVFVLANITVVLGANIAFVYVVLYESSQLQTLAQVLLSLFKLVWSMAASPYMIRQIDSYFMPTAEGPAESFFILQLLVALFNNIAIPCLVIAAIDPNCFSNILLPPSTQTVSYLLPGCLEAVEGHACDSIRFTPMTLQFTPPFTYSYQCSASFITSYAPTFIYMSISTAFLNPLLYGILLWLHERLSLGSRVHHIVGAAVPRILKPPPTGEIKSQDYRHHPLFGSASTMVTLLTQLGILLTFGAIFPPVALAMAVSISAVVFMTRYKARRFVHAAAEAQLVGYLDIIQAECKSIATSAQLQLAVAIVLSYSCAFYTLFLFDTLGDAVGFDASVWVLIVVPLAPYVGWAAVVALRRHRIRTFMRQAAARSSAQEASSIELGTMSVTPAGLESGVAGMENVYVVTDIVMVEPTVNALHVRDA